MALTKKQKELIIEKRCGICEFPDCYEMKDLQVHHIKRRCQGGTDHESNLKVLCKKHHKMLHSGEFTKR